MAVEDRSEFRDLMAAFWKHRVRLLVVFLACIALGVVVTLRQTPLYLATCKIEVDTNKDVITRRGDGSDTIAEMLDAGRRRSMQTEIQVIKSSAIAEDAVKALGLPPGSSKSFSVNADSSLDADVIELSVSAMRPALARDVANAIADAYIRRSQDTNRASARQARKFLEAQVASNKVKLSDAENRLKWYKERAGIASVPDEIAATMERLAKTQTELATSRTQTASYAAQLDAVNALLSKSEKTYVAQTSTSLNPLITQLNTTIASLEQDRATALQEYQPNTPEVKAVEDKINKAKGQLVAETSRELIRSGQTVAANPARLTLIQQAADTQAQYKASEARTRALAPVVNELRASVKALPARERSVASLSREVANQERMYTELNADLQQVALREQAQLASANILDAAELPLSPFVPKVPLNLALAALAGLMLATALGFLLDHLDETIRSPEDTEMRLGLPTLGVIPEASRVEGAMITGPKDRTLLAESFRLLGGNLRFASPDLPVRSLMITSPGMGEGKSTAAVNLAIALASAGLRVALVDGDLRNPSVARMLGLETRRGLTNVVLDGLSVEDALQGTHVPNLSVLAPGPLPPNPAEFLNSQRCRAVFKQLAEMMDFVVYDAPPASVLPDSLVLSTEVDGVLLIARWGKTTRQELRRVTARILAAHGSLLGICVNRMHTDGRGYGYYTYFRYYSQDALAAPSGNGSAGPDDYFSQEPAVQGADDPKG
ncbi:MAG TPA: polysaccharide biosynthesis tyrosine autokinase [Armatimonadota bacterium]|jgi:capsular exopolysaccharide synthesis family protein